MSYLCIKKQEPTAGAKGILCGGVFLPIESYESDPPTPASQIPSEGLALYVPLSEAPNASEWAGYGSITYKTVDGVPCAYFNGDNRNGLYMGGKAFETQTFTVSIIFNTKSFSPTSGYMPYLVNFGTSSSDNSRLALRLDNYYSNNKNALAMVYNGVYLLVQNLSTDTWYSAQMKFDGSQISLYLNGELQSQLNVSAMEIQSGVWIGKSPSNDGAFNGYLSSMRVYNRALSDAEIALLAREFVFNSAPLAGRKGLLVPVGESVVAPPANGLVFYASLSEESSTAETGQTLTKNGTITYQTYKGIQCAHFSSAYISSQLSDYITPYPMTFAIWAAPDTTNSRALWSFSKDKPLMYWNGSYHVYEPDCNVSAANVGDWHHIAWSINSDRSSTYYFDGVAMGTVTSSNTSAIKSMCIGYRNSSQPQWIGYLAGFRIYNRALSEDEISAVAGEYTPEA